MTVIKGRVHRFTPNDNINTDYVISGRYKFQTDSIEDMAVHLMEDIAPDFYQKITPGDFMVAGKNFGCGSSREQAPRVIRAAKIGAVIAKSFARIFFRNAFNVGLLLIEADTDQLTAGDELEIDLDKGILTDKTSGKTITVKPLPPFMAQVLADGGLVPHLKKHGSFKL